MNDCVGLIGDIVKSKQYSGPSRGQLQVQFKEALAEINAQHEDDVLADFVITIGDEFQGLLKTAECLPDIVWEIESYLRPVEMRLGIGLGNLDTPLAKDALAMDGPVWHRARQALSTARTRLGGVFVGFGSDEDILLNGIARILHFVRAGLTDQQHKVVAQLRKGKTQEEIADLMEITRQAVSKHSIAAGWEAYREAEDAWHQLLQRYRYHAAWEPE